MKFLHTTWCDIQTLCKVVADKVVEFGYSPDIIVAISRGGFTPARLLCDRLDINLLASMGIKYYKSLKETEKKPVISFPLNADVKGKKVLIVDDVADTGNSLVTAKAHVIEREAGDVKIATLHYKPWSVIEPDFYAEVTDAWVVYVWETRETVRHLIDKFKKEGKNMAESKNQLKKLGFEEKMLKDFLNS